MLGKHSTLFSPRMDLVLNADMIDSFCTEGLHCDRVAPGQTDATILQDHVAQSVPFYTSHIFPSGATFVCHTLCMHTA